MGGTIYNFLLKKKNWFGPDMIRDKTLVAFDLRALPLEAHRAGVGARKQQSCREIGRGGTKRSYTVGGHERCWKAPERKCNSHSRLTLMEDQFYQQRVARHGPQGCIFI